VEQTVDAGGQRFGFGLARIGDLANELARLDEAGEGEGAVFHAFE
jgi:hypothetical protein